jgi:hypothetical protein
MTSPSSPAHQYGLSQDVYNHAVAVAHRLASRASDDTAARMAALLSRSTPSVTATRAAA